MYYYIVNPAAGNSNISSIQDKLKTTLHRLEIDGEFTKTIGSGDAQKITKNAIRNGFKTIVAVGGGETVNEVLTAVHEANARSRVAVGIIPTGKQNLLARHLGIENWKQACEVLSARRLQSYNLLNLNEYVFIYSGAIGNPAPESESEGAEPKRWQKLFQSSSRLLESLQYKLKIDGKYSASGECGQILLRNQKFLNPDLPNQLVVHILPAHSASSPLSNLWQKVQFGAEEAASYSQLIGDNVLITTRKAAQATIDGRVIAGKLFRVALADESVQLITNHNRLVEL